MCLPKNTYGVREEHLRILKRKRNCFQEIGMRKTALEKIDVRVHTPGMDNKQIVEDLLQRIPEGASLHDIAQEIEFVAAVRQGLDELDRGERIPIDEIERELPSWIIR